MMMSDTGYKALTSTTKQLNYLLYLFVQVCAKAMPRGARFCIALTLLVLAGVQPVLAQKVYPVEAQVQITPPYSLFLSDYTTGDERLKVNLFLKDLTKSDYPVRLKLKIEGFGITITSRNNFYTPPIYLNGGQMRVLSGPELQDYFNPQNLMFQGIDLKTFNQNGAKLPEGVYRISFEVEDYTRRQIVSNAGGTVLSAFLSYPPVINQPMAEAKVRALFPQNLVFQWMPRHTASVNAAFNVAYRIRLVEIDPPGRNPNDAIRSMRPLFETVTDLTQYVYGPADPQLTPGNTYALQVQAIDVNGRDAFVNQGYSEVVRFTYGEKCSLPLNVIAQIEDRNSLKLSWTQLPLQQRYAVRYREANNPKAEWFEQELYTTEFSARGLRPGVTYEYQVKAACDYGFGDYTALQTFTLPNESLTTGDIACGQPSQLQAPTNTKLLPILQPGMLFMAASFPVNVTEVSSQGERFTGRGTVGVPYLNSLNFEVEFKDIQINTDLKLISGKVSVRRQSLEQSQQAVLQAVTVTPDKDGIVEAIASNGLPTIIDAAVTEPGVLPVYTSSPAKTVTFAGILNSGEKKEITIKLQEGQPPFVFQDKNGETYEVDKDGKVTHRGKVSPASLLAGGSLTNRLLSTDKATVTFIKAPDQKYGLDQFQKNLASNNRYTEDYQKVATSQGTTYVSWKSVEAGSGDKVIAEVKLIDTTIKLENIEFRTGQGDKLKSTQIGKSNQFTIELMGAPEGNNREIYAFYPNGKEGLNLGKLNVASFKKINKKVVIVPVNGAGEHLSAETIRTYLNSIYKQAIVDWEVIKEDKFVAYTDGVDGWDLDRNGLDVGNSNIASAYTNEQKKLISLYEKQNKLQDQTYYLFLVNRFSDPGQKGYMVRGGQVGFVKVLSHDTETDKTVLHTMAHELSHGAFKLEHTWDEYGKGTQGNTANLMDYGSGTELWYGQWKYMRNQDVIFRPFQRDEQGAEQEKNYFIIRKEATFLSPSGKLVKLPENSKIFFYCIDFGHWPNGALYGFELPNKKAYVIKKSNLETPSSFEGYFEIIDKNGEKSLGEAYKDPNIYKVGKQPITFIHQKNFENRSHEYWFIEHEYEVRNENTASGNSIITLNYGEVSVDEASKVKGLRGCGDGVKQSLQYHLSDDWKKFSERLNNKVALQINGTNSSGFGKGVKSNVNFHYDEKAQKWEVDIKLNKDVLKKKENFPYKADDVEKIEKTLNEIAQQQLDKFNGKGSNSKTTAWKVETSDGGEHYHAEMNIFEWGGTIADLGVSIYEEAALPQVYWKQDEAKYSSYPIHAPPLVTGVADGVIEEVTDIPQLVKLGAELATDQDKAKALWNSVKEISPAVIKNAVVEGVESKIGQYTDSRTYVVSHTVGKDGVMVASMLYSGFAKLALDKAALEVGGIIKKNADDVIQEAAELVAKRNKWKDELIAKYGDDIKAFDPQGKSVRDIPKETYKNMLNEYSDDLKLSAKEEYLADVVKSGSDVPVKKVFEKGEALIKIVPAGKDPGFSPFYVKEAVFEKLKNSPDLEQKLGLPLGSHAAQYDVFKAVAKESVNVFESTIAPTIQNGYKTVGGATQSLILNIEKWDLVKMKPITPSK